MIASKVATVIDEAGTGASPDFGSDGTTSDRQPCLETAAQEVCMSLLRGRAHIMTDLVSLVQAEEGVEGVAIRGGVMAGALGAACRVMGGPTHSWATGAASRACLLQGEEAGRERNPAWGGFRFMESSRMDRHSHITQRTLVDCPCQTCHRGP
ncbi:g1595 [Coccomyxa viridis]|uniref:G1595 protein n=1 Tax=Coccomyxa viridis TaxID=1274662 RepID=A0ABP1FIE4_9CHLO